MQVETPPATKTFSDRVAEAVEHKRSQLVVGLDPRLDLLPVELRGDAHVARSAAADAVARFCCGIVDAVAPHAVAVKPQLAFFEALGADGMAALRTRAATRAAQGCSCSPMASGATSAPLHGRTPLRTSSAPTARSRSPTR